MPQSNPSGPRQAPNLASALLLKAVPWSFVPRTVSELRNSLQCRDFFRRRQLMGATYETQ
jgi:hypothetical protein